MSRKDLSLRAIFAAPLLLFVLSMIGLVGALLGDGLWDWVGQGLLASTMIVLAWVLVTRRRR
ncbi:MAG: hypothetical protein V4820_02450 [Pseudomonadota bacterium]|uniref:hypothetical protein n=1 Tax=Phenylobacterium sp. TaxID=1871053 RepID=UPI002717C150|nr:hypothetical protein [Phenylobacterium sp.]MDO9433650.1 hypothetical protein [Phenylobacterium sp.]